MDDISQSIICKHLEEMLKIAKSNEHEGILKDGGKTVASIEKTIKQINQNTNYLQIIVSIKHCSKFPCNILNSSLLHNNEKVRSIFYEMGIRICTNYYHCGSNLLCGGVENGEAISMLTNLERQELDEIFGL